MNDIWQQYFDDPDTGSGGGYFPPLPPDLNFAAPNVPQQSPTPFPTGSNPYGYDPMSFDLWQDIHPPPPASGGGSITIDDLTNPAPPGFFSTPPGVEPDVLPAQPYEHPGIHTSDLVHALAADKEDQGLGHQLGLPTRYGDVGKFFKDAYGNVVDATGKIVAAVGHAADAFINNIMNDPGYSSPDYLTSIGYNPGQGTGSLYPASVTGPTPGAFDTNTGGVGGAGGSFFHGSQYAPSGPPDVGPSAMNPGGYNYPRHGATSIFGGNQAGGYGGGSYANAAALGGGNWQNRLQYVLRNIAGGGQGLKYPAPGLTNSFMSPEYRRLLLSKGLAAPTMSRPTPAAAGDFFKQVQERGYLSRDILIFRWKGHADLQDKD